MSEDLLTAAEIQKMRAELPSISTPPPPGREEWDVRRIIRTLSYLTEGTTVYHASFGFRRSVRDAMERAASILNHLAWMQAPTAPDLDRDVKTLDTMAECARRLSDALETIANRLRHSKEEERG